MEKSLTTSFKKQSISAPSQASTPFETQRQGLQVPEDLRDKPVFVILAHKTCTNFQPNLEKHLVIDLSATPRSKVMSSISDILSQFPDSITNIMYCPPLDRSGWANEGSRTFNIEHHNYRYMTERVEQFLNERSLNPVLDSPASRTLNP